MNELITILLSLVLAVFPTLASAEDAITETYVIDKLYGHHRAATEVLPSFVIQLRFPTEGGSTAERQNLTANGDATSGELHSKLSPLGRALASDALRGFGFAITVRPDRPVSTDEDDRGALQLAQEVQRYLVDHFAVPPDRLRIGSGNDSTTAGTGVDLPQKSRSWLIEISRLQ